jgi:two-component system cell cycle sensor histidine kinase/response regulator CckA
MANEQRDGTAARTILAVDDEADLLEAVRRVLTRRGHEVLAATGPAEALDLCRRHGGDIDLLLTDVRMPGGTGTELAHQLAELRPGLSVLFMSGLYDARDGELDSGARVVAKPFTPASLAEAVEDALSASAGH